MHIDPGTSSASPFDSSPPLEDLPPAGPPDDSGDELAELPPSTVEPHPAPALPPPPDPLAELRRSAEYRRDLKFIELMDRLENGQGFYQLENAYGGALGAGLGDGLLSRADVRAAADDPAAPTALRALAQEIVANPGLMALLDSDGNGVVSAAALRDRLAAMRAHVSELERAALHPGAEPAPPVATGPGAQPAALGGGDPGPHFTSARGGYERTGEALGYVTDRIADLDAQLTEAATASPVDQKRLDALQAERQELLLSKQLLQSLRTQQFEALSNELKLLARMAQTSIDNMR